MKISNMIIRLFWQDNHNENESHNWCITNNDYNLKENNKKCLYGSLSAIYT